MTKKKIRLTMEAEGPSYKVNKEEMALAVRTFRLRKGLTQQALGELFNLSRWTIMKVENAVDIHWTTAYKIFAKLSEELMKEGGKV